MAVVTALNVAALNVAAMPVAAMAMAGIDAQRLARADPIAAAIARITTSRRHADVVAPIHFSATQMTARRVTPSRMTTRRLAATAAVAIAAVTGSTLTAAGAASAVAAEFGFEMVKRASQTAATAAASQDSQNQDGENGALHGIGPRKSKLGSRTTGRKLSHRQAATPRKPASFIGPQNRRNRENPPHWAKRRSRQTSRDRQRSASGARGRPWSRPFAASGPFRI